MTRPVLVVGLLGASLHAAVVGAAPTAHEAWIALGPPGSATLAGYLTLRNTDATATALVAVSSSEFASVELHRTEQDGDSVRMRPVLRLEIPAQASVELAPGGTHLMLFAPRATLAAGQRVTLTLRFADGTTLTVAAEVRDPRSTAADHHQHHAATD